MSLDHPAVVRVQACLRAAGSSADVIAPAGGARTAQEAADGLGCALGAIVKSPVFTIDGRPVMALIAGDRKCDEKALPAALGPEGKAKRASVEQVRAATGFAVGGVAPPGHPMKPPPAIDGSLERFETVYAAAGHPNCVFPTTVKELVRLTGGKPSQTVVRE